MDDPDCSSSLVTERLRRRMDKGSCVPLFGMPNPDSPSPFAMKMSLLQPEEEPKEEAAPAKPVVGIIYPPPEVRNIVDKTASFVAR